MPHSKNSYEELASVLPVSMREIARRADTSRTTVEAVLGRRTGQHFSEETAARVRRVIKSEAERISDALNRLSGGATG